MYSNKSHSLILCQKSLNKRSLIKSGVGAPRASCAPPQLVQWPAEAFRKKSTILKFPLS